MSMDQKIRLIAGTFIIPPDGTVNLGYGYGSVPVAGLTIEQAMTSVGQAARGPWKLFDAFHPRNVATAFAELEWEDE